MIIPTVNSQPYEYGSNLHIVWATDPKMLGVRLARYKFVSKMFKGFNKVFEVGAGDGFLSRVVEAEVNSLITTDANPGPYVIVWNPVEGPYSDYGRIKGFDGAYALDVLEHVPKTQENAFMTGIAQSLKPDGCLIIGIPSIELQPYASQKSKESHINCKTQAELKDLMSKYFKNVFMFGMNDEIVNTGFEKMSCYHIGLGVGVK